MCVSRKESFVSNISVFSSYFSRVPINNCISVPFKFFSSADKNYIAVSVTVLFPQEIRIETNAAEDGKGTV